MSREEETPVYTTVGVDPMLFVMVLKFLTRKYGNKPIAAEVYNAMIASMSRTEGLFSYSQKEIPKCSG